MSDNNRAEERFDAKIGDRVRHVNGGVMRHGQVVEIGIMNSHGYPLDIMVEWSNGSRTSISPFGEEVAILVPNEEIPEGMKGLLELNNLECVRETARGGWVYAAVAKRTVRRVYRTIRTVERADLYFQDGEWWEGRPDIEDSETATAVNGIELAEPENFEPNRCI